MGGDRSRFGAKALALLATGVLLVGGCAAQPHAEVGESHEEESQSAAGEVSGLERCEDVAMVTPGVEGNLGARQNPNAVMEVIGAYRDEHSDTYGGRWIDRDYRLAVVAFTDDPDSHREAIGRMLPPSDDVMFDVVKVKYTEAELKAIQQQITAFVSGREIAESMLSAVLIRRNRVSIDLVNPPEGAIEELASAVSDPAAVCVSVYHTPEPPSGPLQVIPDLAVEDPLVKCTGIDPVPYSHLINPLPLDQIDHPAAEALRDEQNTLGGEPMPQGEWVAIHIDEQRATFGIFSPNSFAHIEFERSGDRWRMDGLGSGPPCEPTVVLPEGLNRVIANLDPDSLPNPDSTSIDLLVTEAACASGREMGDALQGPQVVETDTEVLVAFAAVPISDRVINCQGNPSSRVSVELSQPLGNRTIYDGLYVPPKPLLPDAGTP